jgi:hypothetical protein
VLLYVLLVKKYQLVSLAITRDVETPQAGRVNKDQCANPTLLSLLGVQSLEMQTAPQQKQETSVSVWAQSP